MLDSTDHLIQDQLLPRCYQTLEQSSLIVNRILNLPSYLEDLALLF